VDETVSDVTYYRAPPAKLRPPRSSSGDITRQLLMSDPSVAAANIVAMCAPAGFGKTTLAVQLVALSTRTPVWITLDASDRDPAVLITTVFASLEHHVQGQVFPKLELDTTEPDYSRRVRPGFLSAVAEVQGPLTLIFDDIHVLGDGPAALLLADLIEQLPMGFNAILLGRQLDAIPTQRWAGRGRLVELRATDLAFDSVETKEALESFRSEAVSASDAERVHAATQGWPVLVYLCGTRTGTGADTGELDVSRCPYPDDGAIDRFLEEEVLQRLPSDLGLFLGGISVVDSVDPSLAIALTDDPDSGKLLEQIHKGTLLLSHSGDDWFRIHPAVKEHLEHHLKRSEPLRFSQQHGKAAKWYLAHKYADHAVMHAIESDLDLVLGEIIWPASRLALLGGRTASVANWIDRIPQDRLASYLPLSLTAAWVGMAFNNRGMTAQYTEASLHLIDADWQQQFATSEFAPQLAVLLAAQSWGGPETAVRLAAEAFAWLPVTDPIRPLARMIQGVDGALAGDEEASEQLREAGALADTLGIATTAVEAHAFQALVDLSRGNQKLGLKAGQTAKTLWKSYDYPDNLSTRAIMALADAATIAARGGQLARQTFSEAAANLDQIRNETPPQLPWFEALSLAILAFGRARVGRFDRAESALKQLQRAGDYSTTALVRDWRIRAEEVLASAIPLSELSPAERRVWDELLGRLTLGEIAEELCLSRETVKSHAAAIYRKLRVSSRREIQEQADSWGQRH
jgi:LuxR family maltose regulon positive regulatory protein